MSSLSPRRLPQWLLECVGMSTARTAFVYRAVMVSLLSAPAVAQWLNYPTAGVPKTADGLPNLKAPTPRTSDGKPDLSGLWMPQGTLVPSDKFVNGFRPRGYTQISGPGGRIPCRINRGPRS
jgi:hypothetical protein